MASSEQNELYGLQTENRHLQEMIGALRDEMEKMRIGEQVRLQKALAAANDEIGQLRNMIVALRPHPDDQGGDHRRRPDPEQEGGPFHEGRSEIPGGDDGAGRNRPVEHTERQGL